MTKSFRDMLDNLEPEDLAYVEQRGQEILSEYLTLQELRKAHQFTQEKMASVLNVRQENISRLEKRSDLMLSTLRDYIQGMGGNLKLVVEFPGCTPVILKGFQDFDADGVAQ